MPLFIVVMTYLFYNLLVFVLLKSKHIITVVLGCVLRASKISCVCDLSYWDLRLIINVIPVLHIFIAYRCTKY